MFAESPTSRPINIHEQVLGSWMPQKQSGGQDSAHHGQHAPHHVSVQSGMHGPVIGRPSHTSSGPGLWENAGHTSWNDQPLDRSSDRHAGFLPGPSQAERLAAVQRQSWRLQAIADLAPSLAHEFNNLMMIISARTLLVHASAPSSEKVGIHLQAIDQSAERAREMARCLLSLVRPEIAEWAAVDMHALISESAAMLRRLLPPEVRVRVDVPRHPVVLHGCGDMLRQSILHAAARAWKQVRDGGELLISLAPPDSGQMSVPGGWLRLSMSHEAESSMRRAFVPEAESVHFAAMQALIGEHGGVVSEHALPGGRRLDFLLPVRGDQSHHGDSAQFDQHATARHTLDRWLLLVSSDTRVQQRVAEALVATGWSLVTVPSLNCPQTRPDFGSMAEQRPSGVIIDLATARPDQLPAQLASACRDLPCLVVGGDRGQASFKSDVNSPPLPGTFGAFTQANDGRRDAESKRRGGEQLPSMPFAGEPSRRAPAQPARNNTSSSAAQHGNSVDHPLDRQVVQRWVDQLTRVSPAASSIDSPTTNPGPHTGTFFGGLR